MTRELNKREKQDYIYNVLCEFDKYTRKHNLKYMLFYGTLLGAIRHNGFIPWDDDVDVVMDTENYEKLSKLAEANPYLDENKRYKINLVGDENYAYPIIKVSDTSTVIYESNFNHKFEMGLFVDVFVLDDIDDNSLKDHKRKRLYTQFNKICISGNYTTTKYKIMAILVSPIKLFFKVSGMDYKYWNKKIATVRKLNTEYVGNLRFPDPNLEKFPKKDLQEIIYHKFEDGDFPIPKEYDSLLRLIYGDYMQIPSKENQIEHNYIAIVK